MALSMDEERMLAEIASQLRQDDPALADRFSRFGRRGRRSPGIRLIALLVVAVLIVVTLLGAAVAAPA